MQALIDNDVPITLVISSCDDAYALTRAQKNGITAEVAQWSEYRALPNGRAAFTKHIIGILLQYNIDIVVLGGFMVILDESLCAAYPRAVVNVHPSLIPAFSGEGYYGLKVHKAALARGVKVSGATVHYVNEICDGGEIIAQKAVPVLDGDTPETLQARVMQVEREILPEAVKKIIEI